MTRSLRRIRVVYLYLMRVYERWRLEYCDLVATTSLSASDGSYPSLRVNLELQVLLDDRLTP